MSHHCVALLRLGGAGQNVLHHDVREASLDAFADVFARVRPRAAHDEAGRAVAESDIHHQALGLSVPCALSE